MSFFLFFIPNVGGFCELDWRYYNQTLNVTAGEHVSEPGNALSSLVYSGFGIVGLLQQHHSNMYYMIMTLFILMGITSGLHHYFISYGTWTHAADVITMELLTGMSLFYIVCDNEYQCFCFKKIFNTIIVTGSVSMLVLFKIDNGERTLVLQILVGAIVASQILICSYFFYINSILKYRIIKSSLLSASLFSLGVTMWYTDVECPVWMWNTINGHSIWHISLAWSLFNVINITNVCRYEYNYIKYTWKPFIKIFPSILYLIILSNEKSNIRNSFTNISYQEIPSSTELQEIK